MSAIQTTLIALGIVTVIALIALALALAFIGKLFTQQEERGDLPCCYRPVVVKKEWQGCMGDFCINCGLWQAPPEPAKESSPGTSGKGALERPTEGRSDAA